MQLRLNEFSPSTWLTQVPEQTRVRAWGLSCRVKAVKGGGSHSNPPGISCSGMWEQGPGPPGCGVKAVLVPQSWWYPQDVLSLPAHTLQTTFQELLKPGTFLLQSPCGTLELNCCQKGGRRLEQSLNPSGTSHLSHFHPGKALKSKP